MLWLLMRRLGLTFYQFNFRFFSIICIFPLEFKLLLFSVSNRWCTNFVSTISHQRILLFIIKRLYPTHNSWRHAWNQRTSWSDIGIAFLSMSSNNLSLIFLKRCLLRWSWPRLGLFYSQMRLVIMFIILRQWIFVLVHSMWCRHNPSFIFSLWLLWVYVWIHIFNTFVL